MRLCAHEIFPVRYKLNWNYSEDRNWMIRFEIDIYILLVACSFFYIIKWWTVAWQRGVVHISSISFFSVEFLTCSMAWEVVYGIIYQRLLCRQESGSQCETFNCATWTRARPVDGFHWYAIKTHELHVWAIVYFGVNFLLKKSKCLTRCCLLAISTLWNRTRRFILQHSNAQKGSNSNDLTLLCKKLTSGFDSCMSKLLTGRRFADSNRQNVCEQAKKHQPKRNLVIYQG